MDGILKTLYFCLFIAATGCAPTPNNDVLPASQKNLQTAKSESSDTNILKNETGWI